MPFESSTPARPIVPPRPFLKWAGGKGQLIQQYLPHFPQQFTTYYEPFLGGGAVFFHLQPRPALLIDINPELVNTYRCVRDRPQELIALLQHHQQQHGKDYYYKIRASRPESETEKAARLIYLNKTCYNGLYRENSKGHFNVPMGNYRNPGICNPNLLHSASQALQGIKLEVNRFERVLDYAHNPSDFVYFDPPYHPLSSTSSFTAYSRYSFSSDDQIRVRDTFKQLADRGVQVMLSNSDCEFIRDLYASFKIHPIQATRAINSKVDKRGRIQEIVVTSY
uniref:Site-specific DNA-methyltransferase (adenine-specific) n=1 Tax=Cyanothece sp. (strain PCC 7425 / ATCC 29141) TaxID=395961 RepID=B8HTS4_CYAP4